MNGPVGAFAGTVGAARHLDKAIVEGEVVAERILPALRVFSVEGEFVHDELVDLRQGEHLVG